MAIVINGSGTVTGISVGGLPDDIVDAGTLADNAVGLAQMAGGTDGNIITYDTSGNPAVVATGSAGQVLTSAGADAVPTMAAAASGLSECDQWRINTNTSLSADWYIITSNFERVDNGGFGYIGTGMTESSGVFSFPSTGYWLIHSYLMFGGNDTGARGIVNSINTTVDDGTWVRVTKTHGNHYDGESSYTTVIAEFLFDVTSISTHKVKFELYTSEVTELKGDTNLNMSFITFTKVGDT